MKNKKNKSNAKKSNKIEDKNLFGYTLANDAIEDYISGRMLFENGMYLVAIQLATTAIEKLFKSFVNFIHNEKVDERIHKPYELYNYAEVYFKQHEIDISTDFLKWLDLVYVSRYSSELYPGKIISFGDRHFLYHLDSLFFQLFSLYTKMNEEVSELYFSKGRQKKIKRNNYFYSGVAKEKWLKQPQKVVKAMFLGGRRTDLIVDIYFYYPTNVFIFEDGVVNEGALQAPIDFGVITDVELRAINRKYWLIKKIRFGWELIMNTPYLAKLIYHYRIKHFFKKKTG